MPRKPRIEYSGAFYHVITRGNQKQYIFKDASDHEKYLQLLASYKQRRQFRLYAYVLMNNHLHLLIETGDIPLSKILQGLNQSYTLHFNRKYRTVGHLFQGRYKAILCDRERYLLSLLKYIHYNPVRAKIAETPSRYRWSSDHLYRAGGGNGLVDTDAVLRLFSESRTRARRKYREFMDDGAAVKKQDVYATVDERLLGDDAFVDKIAEEHGTVNKERRTREHSLARIAGVVAQAGGFSTEELRAGGRQRSLAQGRVAVAVLARECGYRCAEIAAYLGKDPTAVTQYVRKRDAARALIAAGGSALGEAGK